MNAYVDLGNNFYFIPCIGVIANYRDGAPDLSVLDRIVGEQFIQFSKNPFINTKYAFPVEISLFPSVTCNLKCSYCYYSAGENNDAFELTTEQMDVIIRYLIKNSKIRKLIGHKYNDISVTLTGGGEPTCNWNNFVYFITTLKECAKKNNVFAKVYLITNGVLNDKQLDFICEKVDYIQISYDGLSEIQNRNRRFANGAPSAGLVEHTMREFSARKKEFIVRSTVQPKDYIKIYDMAKKIFDQYEYAMKYHIEPLQYTGRGSAFERDTQLDNEILINEYIRTQKMILSTYPNREFYSTLFKYKIINISCSSITGESPVFDNQGILFPCSDRLDKRKQSIGYIINDDIEISRGSFFEEQYEKLIKTECGSCNFFSLCGGGCFSTFKRDSKGELLAEGKVKCELLKQYWMIAIEQLCQNKKFLELDLIFQDTIDNWDIYLIHSKSFRNIEKFSSNIAIR